MNEQSVCPEFLSVLNVSHAQRVDGWGQATSFAAHTWVDSQSTFPNSICAINHVGSERTLLGMEITVAAGLSRLVIHCSCSKCSVTPTLVHSYSSCRGCLVTLLAANACKTRGYPLPSLLPQPPSPPSPPPRRLPSYPTSPTVGWRYSSWRSIVACIHGCGSIGQQYERATAVDGIR